jgi:hypothetical protein
VGRRDGEAGIEEDASSGAGEGDIDGSDCVGRGTGEAGGSGDHKKKKKSEMRNGQRKYDNKEENIFK